VFSKFSFKSCRLWHNMEEICKAVRPQIIIWYMRIACWIPKTTNTHSQYVILIAFPLRKRLIVSFYVHCPSTRTFRSPGLCKLLVAVPFQTKPPAVHGCPPLPHTPGDAVPIFPSRCICRHKSRHSLFCVLFLHVHVVMRRATVMYIYSHCWRIVFIGTKYQAAQWTRVRTRGIDEKSVRTLKWFVNFYCRCGRGLAILPPYYARAS
jgi:hypothetical protein